MDMQKYTSIAVFTVKEAQNDIPIRLQPPQFLVKKSLITNPVLNATLLLFSNYRFNMLFAVIKKIGVNLVVV